MVQDPSAAASIPQQGRDAITARLSALDGLRTPGHMQRQASPPSQLQLQQHLGDLLSRDPAVFLERYGSLLQPTELDLFSALRGDYEVDYWCQQAERQASAAAASSSTSGEGTKPTSLSTASKNRRLAYMNRLQQQGDYFSEERMRERAPLLWHEYIGQHEGGVTLPSAGDTPGDTGAAGSAAVLQFSPQGGPVPGAPGGPRGGEAFHDQLLRFHDEAQLQARLAADLQEQECQMSEQEESSEEDDLEASAHRQQHSSNHDSHHHHQQQQEGAAAAVASQSPSDAPGDGDVLKVTANTTAAGEPTSTPLLPAGLRHPNGTHPLSAAAMTGAVADGDMADAPALKTNHNQQQQQQQLSGQGAAAAAAAAGDGKQQQQASQRRADFLDEMQARFLAGGDAGDVDYAAIDADAALDEDWAEQETRDAQDQYFDAD